MSMTQHMEEKLWNYIDGNISPDERTVIDQLLEKDTEWKNKYQELLEINSLLRSSEMEAPSLRFTKNVMEEIAKLHVAPAAKNYINKKIIWGIGIFFITLVVGFLVYGFAQLDFKSGEAGDISKNIGKVDFSKFFNNTFVNVFMMINLVLGLFLLDNYLSSRRKSYMKTDN